MAETWNGNYTQTNSDFWNLVEDMRKQAIYNNRIIPVVSKEQRDALASSAPDGLIPAGTVVCRLDRNGAFDIFVDGQWVEGDAEWVNMTYNSGFTAGTPGQMAYKIAGDTLWIKGGATGTFPQNTYIQPSSTLIPEQFRPEATIYKGSVGSAGRPAGIQISQQGFIQLVSDLNPSWISAATSIPLT